MVKNQKQKFIDIIENIQDCGAIGDGGLLYKACNNKYLAEMLIANNAVVLSAKLGSKVFVIASMCGKSIVEEKEFTLELENEWGKSVFKTREEAEKMLRKVDAMRCLI